MTLLRVAVLALLALTAGLLSAIFTHAAAANAYSLNGCKWPNANIRYQNLGGVNYSPYVTSAALNWSAQTDANLSTYGAANWVVSTYYANDGSAGINTGSCSGGLWIYTVYSRGNTNYLASASPHCRQAVFAHEMGHSLGLSHSTAVSVMRETTEICETTYLVQPDDIAGVNSIY